MQAVNKAKRFHCYKENPIASLNITIASGKDNQYMLKLRDETFVGK